MNYKELIDPELRKSANSFPFNPAIVAVGNLYQVLLSLFTLFHSDLSVY